MQLLDIKTNHGVELNFVQSVSDRVARSESSLDKIH